MPVEINIDPAQIDRALARLEKVPFALEKALLPAVSEVLGGLKSHLTGHLSGQVPLPKKSTGRAVKMSRPSVGGGLVKGRVTVKSGLRPLIEYDVKPQTITARQGMRSSNWPDFSYALRQGGRRAGRSRIEGLSAPFIAKMGSGHLGVYYRSGRNTLKQAYGPSVQYHVATPEMEGRFAYEAERRFPRVLARYIYQALGQKGVGK